MAENKGFDVFAPIKNPIQNSAIAVWWIVIGGPAVLALLFGVYNKSDIFGVIGISARRGVGAVLEESKPVGQTLCEQRYGASSCIQDSFKLPPTQTSNVNQGASRGGR